MKIEIHTTENGYRIVCDGKEWSSSGSWLALAKVLKSVLNLTKQKKPGNVKTVNLTR